MWGFAMGIAKYPTPLLHNYLHPGAGGSTKRSTKRKENVARTLPCSILNFPKDNMENFDTVKHLVSNLDGSILNLQEALQPFFDIKMDEALSKCSTSEEKIKLYHEYLYVTNSVLFAFLKVSGVKTDDHPIMKEIARTKQSMNKLKELKKSIELKNIEEEEKKKKTAEFLQRSLGTTGGLAAPESLKSPAISSANFKGKHTRFSEEK